MTAEAASMPERIGRYDLLIPIGTGGMGSVYLGRHEVMPGIQRGVAIKLMHPQLRADPNVADQLLREAKIAASIKHTNVVSVLEAGETPHGVFLALDYVEGDTLAALIRATVRAGDNMPFAIIARIVHDALTGLHAAHELKDESGRSLNLVHRDFSPQNILVGTDGISRLTDFGIAKALGQMGGTATGIIKGKVGYMAPEQARGEQLDRRCDVWAAGVVAWEAVAGKRLFRGSNDAATLLQVISGERPPLVSTRRFDACEALDEAIAAALYPHPAHRLATALRLRQKLELAWQQHDGIADPEDVGAFVRRCVGDKIEKRRRQAADVERLRKRIATVSMRASVAAEADAISGLATPPDEAPTSGPPAADFAESTRGALSSETTVQASRSSMPYVIAAAAAAAVTIGAFALFGDAPENPPQETTAPRVQAAAETAQGVASAAPQPRVLKLEADTAIAQLRIGERNIALPEPVASIEVPVSEAGIVHIRAIAADGRTLDVELGADQRAVTLDFSQVVIDKPNRRRARPQKAPPKTKSDDKGPGLADSPY